MIFFLPVGWKMEGFMKRLAYRFVLITAIILQSLTLIVHAESVKVITEYKDVYPFSDGYAVKQNISIAEMEEILDYSDHYLQVKTSDGEAISLRYDYDLSNFNSSVLGLHTLKAYYTIPEDYIIDPKIKLPEITLPISVQVPNEPMLDCLYAGKGMMFFPWLANESDVENMNVMLRVNDQEWNMLENDQLYKCYAFVFEISNSLFTKDNKYDIQIFWSGGNTNIFTIYYDDILKVDNNRSGNRDGDDHEENGGDELIQKPPQPPVEDNTQIPDQTEKDMTERDSSEPSEITEEQIPNQEQTTSYPGNNIENKLPAPAASLQKITDSRLDNDINKNPYEGYETITPTSTKISGSRLQYLIENNNISVPFAWDGLELRIPCEILEALYLANDEMFFIEMIKLDDLSFSISIIVNEKPLTNFTDIMVKFAKTQESPSAKAIVCDGKRLHSDIKETDQYYQFSISQNGTYEIEPYAAVTQKKQHQDMTAILWFSGDMLLIAITVFIIYRRRRYEV